MPGATPRDAGLSCSIAIEVCTKGQMNIIHRMLVSVLRRHA